MAMVCPSCGTTQEQRLHCPVCGARLVFGVADQREGGGRGSWLQTPWARVVIGLLLAQGTYHGLRQLAAAGFALAGASPEEAASGAAGPLLTQGLQLFGLLLGGLLAGSSQRSGPLLGTLVGAWNAMLCLALQPATGATLTTVSLYGLPLLQATCGAAAGWLGCFIWKPLPEPILPGAAVTVRKPTPGARLAAFAGPVAWFRVVLGTALAVAGALSAHIILDAVLNAGGGRLSTTDRWHDQMLTWEIKALAVLAGGGLAGANTSNGLKQGLCVALPVSLVLLFLQAGRLSPSLAGLTLLSTFCLSLVGGWFGGQLLPPVVKARRSGRLGSVV